MVSPRIREVQDKKEMQRVVDDFMTQGYTIKEQGLDTTLLKKKTWGSAAGIIVSLVLMFIIDITIVGIVFSWIIPVGYVLYAHYNAPEVLLRIAQAQPQVQAQVQPQVQPQVQVQPQAPLRQTPPPPQAKPPQTQTSTAGKVVFRATALTIQAVHIVRDAVRGSETDVRRLTRRNSDYDVFSAN